MNMPHKPAFPRSGFYCPEKGDNDNKPDEGMTLLEWYRGQALAGLCANGLYMNEMSAAIQRRTGSVEPEILAMAVVKQADYIAKAALNPIQTNDE